MITLRLLGLVDPVVGLEGNPCSLCLFEQYIGRSPFHPVGAVRLLQDSVFHEVYNRRPAGVDQVMVHKFAADGSSCRRMRTRPMSTARGGCTAAPRTASLMWFEHSLLSRGADVMDVANQGIPVDSLACR